MSDWRTACLCSFCCAAAAQEPSVEERLAELERQRAEDRRVIEDLREELGKRDSAEIAAEIEGYLAQTAQAPPPTGAFLDVSAVLLAAAGGSTAESDQIALLQGGHHDPARNGFTLQAFEVTFAGTVDPYLRAQATVVFAPDAEEIVELEEAFLDTLALPGSLKATAGHFFTPFGRHNAQHAHQWRFLDQPLVLTRFFGGDGMRGTGALVSWLAPTPFFLEITGGAQNASGETMPSFLSSDEGTVGGRPFVERDTDSLDDLVYLLRAAGSWDLAESWTAVAGASGLFGPNYTGGETHVYGVDLLLRWRPANAEKGWPFVAIQTEVLWRTYRADAFDDGVTILPPETLEDWGLYAQVVVGFRRPWAAGLRLEYSGGGPGAEGDPLRDDRTRVSLLLAYHTSEFARLRFQVNYDHADWLETPDVLSVWFGVEVGFGAHVAHTY
jgi:hypothetical protein